MKTVLIAYCISLFLCIPLHAGINNCTEQDRRGAIIITSGSNCAFKYNSNDHKSFSKGSILVAQQSPGQHKTDSNPLTFVESSECRCEDGKQLCLDGTVRNNMRTRTLRSVKITVKLYNKDNKLIKTLSVNTSPPDIPAGQEATYEIKTEYDSRIKKYNKSATWKSRIRR